MPSITLDNVSLNFPIYDSESRSLTSSVSKVIPVGGIIQRKKGKRTSILALNNITASFEEGDRVALIGHNGAGKTSFLKLLAGFYEPTAGTLRREGRVSTLINLMAGLDINVSGYENILLCGMLYGLKRQEVVDKVKGIAEFSELGAYLDMPVRLYSSGMVLRLAFSICTSIDSEILLLDEWIGAGDNAFIKKTQERLSEMVFNSTIMVFATHNPDAARMLCNKAMYLEHGRLLKYGNVEDVLAFGHEAQMNGN